MHDRYENIRLSKQVCFPLYVCSKEVVKRYNAELEQYGLTYTQYIAMMVMWEFESVNVKEMGKYLFLDSGTLTPLLKTLEKKGFVTRTRSREDERQLIVSITEKGSRLKDEVVDISTRVGKNVSFDQEDIETLRALLFKLVKQIS